MLGILKPHGKPRVRAFVLVSFRWLFGLLGAFSLIVACFMPDCELTVGKVLITLPIWRVAFVFAGTFSVCLALFLPSEYAMLVIRDRE